MTKKKNNVEFPGVLVFGLEFPRDLTQFFEISRGVALHFVLSGIYSGR